MDPRTLAVAALCLLVGGGVVYAFASDDTDAETERLERAVEVTRDSLAEARRAVQVVDSVAAIEIREARQTRTRMDTVWRASVDTLRAALPDTLRPVLERLVAADSAEDAAYEAEIDALERKVATRDTVIDALEGTLRAQRALTDRLRERLNPSVVERIFGSVGEGALRGGVVGLAVVSDHPEAAAGAGAMWAVDALF